MYPLKDIMMVGTVLRYSTHTSEVFLINEMNHAVKRLEQVAVDCNDTLRPTHVAASDVEQLSLNPSDNQSQSYYNINNFGFFVFGLNV